MKVSKLLVGSLITVGLVAGIVLYVANRNGISADIILNPATISTNFPSYYQKEPVKITINNNSKKSIQFNNSGFWTITDSRGTEIYKPQLSTQSIITVNPGTPYTWTWDQKDNNKLYAKPGNYKVNVSNPKLSASFVIKSEMGSSGRFTMNKESGATFGVLITDNNQIRLAIENYYRLNSRHPSGKLVDDGSGKSLYDSQWSWHLDPSSVAMVEVSMELCDGGPNDVEKNKAYWMNSVKVFCPWAGRVGSLQ